VRLKPDFGTEDIIAYIYAVKEIMRGPDLAGPIYPRSSSKNWLSLGIYGKRFFTICWASENRLRSKREERRKHGIARE